MPHDHVAHFVAKHADDFGLVVRGLNGSEIDVNRPARQRKGVNLLLVYNVKREWIARLRRHGH